MRIDFTGREDGFKKWLKEVIARPGSSTRTYDYAYMKNMEYRDIEKIKEYIKGDKELKLLNVYEPRTVEWDTEKPLGIKIPSE